MWIDPAYAQDLGGDGGAGLTSLLPLVLIFVVFYFLLIRPQQKKMKEHRNMVSNVRRGDKIVTGGGLIGKVTKVVSDTEVQVELAEGVKVQVVRGTISDVLTKSDAPKGEAPQPANDPGGAARPTSLLGGLFGKKKD